MPAIADINSATVQMGFVPVLEQTAQVSALTFSQLLGSLAMSEEGVQRDAQAVGAKADSKEGDRGVEEANTETPEIEHDEETDTAQISLIVMGVEIVAPPLPPANQGDAPNRNVAQAIETEAAVTPPVEVDWRKAQPQRIEDHEQEAEKEVTHAKPEKVYPSGAKALILLTTPNGVAEAALFQNGIQQHSGQEPSAESEPQPSSELARATDPVQETGGDLITFEQAQTSRAANAVTRDSGSNTATNIEQTTSHTRVATRQSATTAEIQVENPPNRTAVRIPEHSVNGTAIDVREKEGEKITASSSSSVADIEHIPLNARATDSSQSPSDRRGQQPTDPPQAIELEISPMSRIAFHVERLAERLTGSELHFDWRVQDSSAMQVSTIVRDQVVALGITTESKETATALRTELPTLNAHLNEQSFRLGDVEIRASGAATMGTASDGSQHGAREWRGQTLPSIGTGESAIPQEEVEVWKVSEGSTSVSLLA